VNFPLRRNLPLCTRKFFSQKNHQEGPSLEQHTVLSDNRIGRLLFRLSLPATIGMLVMSLYNVVDTIFIGWGVGTAGIAGVALAFPIQMIVGALGQMIGIGGASLLSRSLGEGNMEKARKTLGNVMVSVLSVGAVITVVGYWKLDDMLRLFGSTDTLLPYAREYLSIVLAGVIFHSVAMSLVPSSVSTVAGVSTGPA